MLVAQRTALDVANHGVSPLVVVAEERLQVGAGEIRRHMPVGVENLHRAVGVGDGKVIVKRDELAPVPGVPNPISVAGGDGDAGVVALTAGAVEEQERRVHRQDFRVDGSRDHLPVRGDEAVERNGVRDVAGKRHFRADVGKKRPVTVIGNQPGLAAVGREVAVGRFRSDIGRQHRPVGADTPRP